MMMMYSVASLEEEDLLPLFSDVGAAVGRGDALKVSNAAARARKGNRQWPRITGWGAFQFSWKMENPCKIIGKPRFWAK